MDSVQQFQTVFASVMIVVVFGLGIRLGVLIVD